LIYLISITSLRGNTAMVTWSVCSESAVTAGPPSIAAAMTNNVAQSKHQSLSLCV